MSVCKCVSMCKCAFVFVCIQAYMCEDVFFYLYFILTFLNLSFSLSLSSVVLGRSSRLQPVSAKS